MSTQILDGVLYAKMLRGGAAMLSEHAKEVNDLNVFPVPDGDTGTNMTKTAEGGLFEIADAKDVGVGAISQRFSHGALLGARGNSGVILSQIFAGISDGLSDFDTADAPALSNAFISGIKRSYSAVQNPTEGTILTVFRESAEYAAKNVSEATSIEEFFELVIEEAKRSLERTKDILPALREADVVDSGAAGYLYIVSGMYATLTGKMDVSIYKPETTAQQKVDISTFTRDSKLEFGYCTEFLLRLTTDKVDPDTYNINEALSVLDELHGESVVAYKEGDILKVHVHTFTPGDILSRMQAFGEFLTVKIENMSLGHSDEVKPKKKPTKKFSTVAVATGEGIEALFSEMGADAIISGGQTSNPSTEEFVAAFRKCDAENIIVLPNNKNVFLAAQQAAELYTGADVHIVPTKSLMQGFSALSVINPGITDLKTLTDSAKRAADSVVGSEITEAVRDVTINGKEIKKGDFIAITDGKITAVSDSAESAVLDMLSELDMDDYELITLFVGKGVSDNDRAALTERIEEEYPDCELTVYTGGQDVYNYMVAVE